MFKVLILAAGKGKRMKSEIPKVLHRLLNRPMISWVIETARKLHPDEMGVVLGYKADEVQKVLSEDIKVFIQPELLGTGHAVMCAEDFLNFDGDLLILYGDVPNIKAETLEKMLSKHREESNSMTILTAFFENPTGYGRILRNESGKIVSIVEEADADEETKKIREINSGIYVFKATHLLNGLKYLRNDNKQREYYLTDLVKIFLESGQKVETFLVDNPREIAGVNDRIQLAKVEKLLRLEINYSHMLNGVTIIDPESTFIDPEVKIENDTVIYPSTFIYGNTTIGKKCEIGPFTVIKDCKIGDNVRIVQSNCEDSEIFSGTSVGPFSRLRPGTVLKENTRIGNFVEVKNSILESGVKANHLSYIGDSEVGENTNVGAGTITCNYDGYKKHRTRIGKNVFIGSNSALVAPLKVGDGAIVGAGSVITEDVPDDSLGIARSRQINKEGWARKWRMKKEKEVQGLNPEKEDAKKK
ncbi:MAG: bifunctional UDP-N-acetylglucosamine pyrophosphorylase / glucosamine-phosphate N-acetyltransferase [Thermotogaceae bacterium]|jgi:bifunctional UDP-N-acetylglucosamine pyrophosphorylase/glucosamine-1-phosphate N-acetyltransferase|nr:bifunctional UDP-N-acetylglucosamine pyrophosphorylase / glucosamine-phosphate N-acetyltransferase [Thermotogaceae bacterium]MDN5337651.1 bifunctional UDP-N-acetylglucosamine pyrophosphorylase / glucosamine-phosphate N-acetyltransferase [Thermotogaceae bacterium]